MSILGTRVIRTEDPRLLTSGGVYVDDLREPLLDGAVRATFVRSTVAHALITGIDTSAALEAPGVVAGVTAGGRARPPPPGGRGGPGLWPWWCRGRTARPGRGRRRGSRCGMTRRRRRGRPRWAG